MSRKNSTRTNAVISRLVGVSDKDSPVEAARKAIALMKSAGLPTKKAEKMLADAIARGVK